MTYFHASPRSDLDKRGISPNSTPHVSRERDCYIYFGSFSYIINEYLSYAPSGTYYIYKVNTSRLRLIHDLPGEQVKTGDYVDPESVVLVKTVENKAVEHPRIEEYREWYREKGYEF